MFIIINGENDEEVNAYLTCFEDFYVFLLSWLDFFINILRNQIRLGIHNHVGFEI